MKPGDTAQIAIWLSGAETEEEIFRFEADCDLAMREAERLHKVEIGPITWSVLRPGQGRAPVVPDHIIGPNVRLLVGEAKVAWRPDYTIAPTNGFVNDLTKDDRAKLRAITRRAHAKMHPGDRLSDKHCDAVIEYLGPDIAIRTLRDGAAVH